MILPSRVEVSIFQSTLSVRRATHADEAAGKLLVISIHALRKESDKTFDAKRYGIKISIHALRKENDRFLAVLFHVRASFQSTLSVRRATPGRRERQTAGRISIHALRKESDRIAFRNPDSFHISIHALRKESDSRSRTRASPSRNFNPRSP